MDASEKFESKVARALEVARGESVEYTFDGRDGMTASRIRAQVLPVGKRPGNGPYRGGLTGLPRLALVSRPVFTSVVALLGVIVPSFTAVAFLATTHPFVAFALGIPGILALTALGTLGTDGELGKASAFLFRWWDKPASSPTMTTLLESADEAFAALKKEKPSREVLREVRARLRDARRLGQVEWAAYVAIRACFDRHGYDSSDVRIREFVATGNVPAGMRTTETVQVLEAQRETLDVQQRRVAELIVAVEDVHSVEREARLVHEQQVAAEAALAKMEALNASVARSNVDVELSKGLRVLSESRTEGLAAERAALAEVQGRLRP